uniref:ARAD1A01826p n=1 Tax=Blastobotrys adeninivorans TaxID=409370 RepID=A0A060SX53_BLAAD
MNEPITLDQFKRAVDQLPLGTIISERQRLYNSILHLQLSNEQLAAEIETDPEDKPLYEQCIADNVQVISQQQQRIDILKQREKTLTEDSNATATPVADESRTTERNASADADVARAGNGVANGSANNVHPNHNDSTTPSTNEPTGQPNGSNESPTEQGIYL